MSALAAQSLPEASRSASRLRLGAILRHPAMLYLPATAYLGVFFLVPLALIAWMSVSEPHLGLANYIAFFESKRSLGVLAATGATAAIVTLCSLALAYPVAYVAATREGVYGTILLLVTALSFWTNFLVRTYAWMVIFSNGGPAQLFLKALGWSHPPRLLYTTFASTLAMVQMLCPLMVFMLYAVMRRIDLSLVRAAGSLGATPLRAFFTVSLPLSTPGVINGVTLVFITCLGFYVTPILIGSPHDMMISGLIAEQLEQLLDFGGAAAASIILLVFTLALFSLYSAIFDIEKIWSR